MKLKIMGTEVEFINYGGTAGFVHAKDLLEDDVSERMSKEVWVACYAIGMFQAAHKVLENGQTFYEEFPERRMQDEHQIIAFANRFYPKK
jgi:hypothetical protein